MDDHATRGVDEVSQGDRTTAGGERETDDVMGLLAEHVPLALLVDLVTPEGPASEEILRADGMPRDAWWEAGSAPEPAPAGAAGGEPAAGGGAEDRQAAGRP
jgi:hypothetical protein